MILCVLWDACRESFYVFGDFYASGAQDAGVTKLLKYTVEWGMASRHIHIFDDSQGCALATPGGPWHLTFVLGQLENLSFFRQFMLDTLDITVSVDQAPFNFP